MRQTATVLGVPPSYFFDEAPGQTGAATPGFAEEGTAAVMHFLSSPEGLLLNKAFVRIRDTKVRGKGTRAAAAEAAAAEAPATPAPIEPAAAETAPAQPTETPASA